MKNLSVRQDEGKMGMTFGFDPSVSLAENPAPVCMFCSTRYQRRPKNGSPPRHGLGLRALLRLATEATLLLGRMATNKLGMRKKNKDPPQLEEMLTSIP